MIPLRDNSPTRIKPVVTFGLIAACVFVFFWEITLPREEQGIIIALSVVPSSLFGGRYLAWGEVAVPPALTLITSMFLHAGFLHLAGNMLYLWIFGNNVEDAMGHSRFIVFYIVCGVVAGLAHALPNATSSIPALGASGAISGVLGAYLLLYPFAKVLVLIPLGFFSRIVHLPAALVLGFWFIFQILSSAASGPAGGGVAFGAHIGGFISGMILIPFFKYKHIRLFKSGRKPFADEPPEYALGVD
jgi:membrane associated rhomboid family serine protease